MQQVSRLHHSLLVHFKNGVLKLLFPGTFLLTKKLSFSFFLNCGLPPLMSWKRQFCNQIHLKYNIIKQIYVFLEYCVMFWSLTNILFCLFIFLIWRWSQTLNLLSSSCLNLPSAEMKRVLLMPGFCFPSWFFHTDFEDFLWIFKVSWKFSSVYHWYFSSFKIISTIWKKIFFYSLLPIHFFPSLLWGWLWTSDPILLLLPKF